MKISAGFTLIELMIVVAIIGILAAIAVPQYQNHIIRTQLVSVVSEVSALRSGVAEALSRGSFSDSVLPPVLDAVFLGYVPGTLTTGVINVFFPQAGAGQGTLTVALGGSVNPSIAGVMVNINRSTGGTWSCNLTNTPAAFNITWVPAGCLLNGNPV